MEETYTTQAIVLNRMPFRERDTRAIVYSIDRGKLELVARGTKKIGSKLASHIEPFCLTNFMVVHGRQFDYIGGAVSENCYQALKEDFNKIQVAGEAINIFNRLIKIEVSDREVFLLLKYFLDILNNNQTDYQLFLHFFILKLLSQLGYKPELDQCVVCHKKILPEGNFFSLSKGGLICNLCNISKKYTNNLTISEDAIKILRIALETDLSSLIKIKINQKLQKEAVNIVSSFLRFHLE